MPFVSNGRRPWLRGVFLSVVFFDACAQGLGGLGGLPPGINIPAAAAALNSLGLGGGLGIGSTALPATPAIRSIETPAPTSPQGGSPRLSDAQLQGNPALNARPNEFQRFVLNLWVQIAGLRHVLFRQRPVFPICPRQQPWVWFSRQFSGQRRLFVGCG